ncbi:unnamed protein product [Clonostachys rosea]|uniref:Nitrogen regulatory protein areA GATA-like domain-containing protein n=1 Tax=Bionectria ochroleuca TaxID=29856 RepID=A0ABY6V3G6_BIOOC|nr:unnamed protein product [Clonostachys rosea]
MWAHSLQDGLSRFERELEAIALDPQQLELDRRRFEQPSAYETATLSGGTTPSAVATPPLDEKAERSEWLFQLGRQWRASLPANLRESLHSLEAGRWSIAMKTQCRPVPLHRDYGDLAAETVRAQWIEQAIWDYTSDQVPKGEKPNIPDMWQHEKGWTQDHFDNPYDSDDDSEGGDSPNISWTVSKPTENHKNAPWPETRTDFTPSRPLFQFLYQVNKEYEWFDDCHKAGMEGFPSPNSDDINTQAYDSVKKRWNNWGVWKSEWGTLPGMSWKHETPLAQFLEQEIRKTETGVRGETARVADEEGREREASSIYSSPSPPESPVSRVASYRSMDFRQCMPIGGNSLASLDRYHDEDANHSFSSDAAGEYVADPISRPDTPIDISRPRTSDAVMDFAKGHMVHPARTHDDARPRSANAITNLRDGDSVDLNTFRPQISSSGSLLDFNIQFKSNNGRDFVSRADDPSRHSVSDDLPDAKSKDNSTGDRGRASTSDPLRRPITPSVEVSADQRHSVFSSPDPSISKPAAKLGFHRRLQDLLSARKTKTPRASSPRKVKVLNYTIWVEHR